MTSRGPYQTSPMPEVPRNLQERLRWLRKRRGLTQVEVAEALGCEQAMISSWEVGRTRPSAVALVALSREYKVSVLALETGDGFLEEAGRALQPPSNKPGADQDLSVTLPAAGAGHLMIMDTQSGNQDRADAAEGMAQLLRALKKGRQAWIVIR
ncbi:MAG: helix-turn-helix transcriptional regulator [Acidobacteria bacterium]|nr:helix-turn-helix transcriptional regulator [Acidobacteriota bacterium]